MNAPLVSLTALFVCAITAQAQPFEVQTAFIGAPVAASRNGPFSVSGVIGQTESGTVFEGALFAVGGGWSAPLIIESNGSPTLLITHNRESGTVSVAWPSSATGHQLEANPKLNDPNGWIVVSSNPGPAGSNLEVTIHPTAQPQFYRLRRSD